MDLGFFFVEQLTRIHHRKIKWTKNINFNKKFLSPFDRCSQDPNAGFTGRHWGVTRNRRHTKLYSGRTLFTYPNSRKHVHTLKAHNLRWSITSLWVLLWYQLQTIMFTLEQGRFSQSCRSFKTTDDSIEYSQALIQDKWQLHTTLLQYTHYAHCPLITTDL